MGSGNTIAKWMSAAVASGTVNTPSDASGSAHSSSIPPPRLNAKAREKP